MSKKDVTTKNIKKDAFDFIDQNKGEIAKIGEAIFYFAELGMQEYRTSEFTTDALRKAGFSVETGIAGMPTAWIATWGSGKPVIAVQSDADALPNSSQISGIAEEKPIIKGAPGHAEGHNTNMAVMIGGAVAVKNVMEKKKMEGTIKLYFAPAEEQLIPRPYILRDGYFDGVDAIFHPHVGSEFSSSYGIRLYALVSVEFIFHGKAAGAATTPWFGRNALDAVVLMDLGWGLMRQQLKPSQSSHRVIQDGGDQPNITPKYTRVWWQFRDENIDLANQNFEKAKKIAEGAAIMTGCTYETNVLSVCWPTRGNKGMAEIIQKNLEMVEMPQWSEEEETLAKELQEKINVPIVGLEREIRPLKIAQRKASCDDSGCVSWVIPTGRITFPSNIPGAAHHSWSGGVSIATTIAHKAEVNAAKVLAASMIDLFMDDELLSKVKRSFEEELGDTKYFEILPKDQKPPVDLNRVEMEKWRSAMERFYIKEKIQWG